MSWRRFCVLYNALSPDSAAFRNYARVARREGLTNDTAERGAWDAFTALARPGGAG